MKIKLKGLKVVKGKVSRPSMDGIVLLTLKVFKDLREVVCKVSAIPPFSNFSLKDRD